MIRLQSALCAFLLSSTAVLAQVPDQVHDQASLWGQELIDLERAFAAGFTGRGVTIGVMDSILQHDHPEYADRLLGTLDLESLSAFGATYNDHATHVAGTIAGQTVGIARGARLVGVRITEVPNDVADPRMAEGYLFSLREGARIFNNSWGINEEIDDKPSTIRIDAVTPEIFKTLWPGHLDAFRLTSQAGAIQVWAAGNGSPNFDAQRMEGGANPGFFAGLPVLFPELQPYWVAVTSLGRNGEISVFADHCGLAAPWCLAAPGEDIVSALPGSHYGPESGTSMAAPHVSGALALAAEMFPAASGPELIQIVLQTATDIGEPGIDPVYGWGRLNIGNIVDTIEPRTAAAFAGASWARSAALGHAAGALRRYLSLPSAGTGLPGRQASYASLDISPDGASLGVSNPAAAGVWISPFSGEARLGTGASSPAARTRTTGLLAGFDLVNDDHLRFGAVGGYSQTHLRFGGAGDDARANALHAGLYGSYRSDGWLLQGTGLLAFFDQSLTRRDIVGAWGTSGTPVGRSDARGTALEADLQIGHAFDLADGSTFTPFMSVTGRSQWTGAFRETGAGIFNLESPAQRRSEFGFGPGLGWQSAPLIVGDATLRLQADIAYTRLFGDRDHPTTVALLGRRIESRTAMTGPDLLRFGGQLSFANEDEPLSGYIGYDGTVQTRGTSHAVSAGMRINF